MIPYLQIQEASSENKGQSGDSEKICSG